MTNIPKLESQGKQKYNVSFYYLKRYLAQIFNTSKPIKYISDVQLLLRSMICIHTFSSLDCGHLNFFKKIYCHLKVNLPYSLNRIWNFQ